MSTDVRPRKPGSVSEPAFGHTRYPPTEPSKTVTPDPATSHDALDHQPKSSGVSVRVTGHPPLPSAALTLARAASGVPAYVTAGQVLRIVNRLAVDAGVIVQGRTGPRPACGLDFRHGSAVHLLRSGVPLTRTLANRRGGPAS